MSAFTSSHDKRPSDQLQLRRAMNRQRLRGDSNMDGGQRGLRKRGLKKRGSQDGQKRNSQAKRKLRFDAAQYQSGDGFMVSTWGPAAWAFLHISSLNYRPSMRKQYQQQMAGIIKTLPCGKCRNQAPENRRRAHEKMRPWLREHNLRSVYDSREAYARFVWQFHHEVNMSLQKDKIPGWREPTFEEMRDDLEQLRASCTTSNSSNGTHLGCQDARWVVRRKPCLKLLFVPQDERPVCEQWGDRFHQSCCVRD